MDNLSKKFRLAVANDWHDKKSAVFWNKDGFLKMLHILREKYGWEVVFFKKHDRTFTWEHDYVELSFSPNPAQQVRNFKPDCILFFSDLSRPIIGELADYPCKKAICYSGGRFTDYLHVPDVIFVESKTYLDWFKSMGKNVIQAFGTNTEIFKPTKQPKIIDAYFPATGAAWKRHALFAEAMGKRGLVSGWWQPHEPQCLEACVDKGVAVLHHQMPESVNYLYNLAHTVLITSSDVGGSQRSVLEAMACGVPPIVMSDSTMTTEYVKEAGFGIIVDPEPEKIREAVDNLLKNPQDPKKGVEYIKNKYTAGHYALAVKEGIEAL